MDRFELIESVAQALQYFERHGKARLKTPQGAANALDAVAQAARNLDQAILALDRTQLWELSSRMPPAGLKVVQGNEAVFVGGTLKNAVEVIDGHVVYPGPDYFFGRVSFLGLESSRLAQSIEKMMPSQPNPEGSQGGRKKTLDHYAGYIGCLVRCLDGAGIKVQIGGDFAQLCGAVYDAAGVISDPEGAIRRYIGNEKRYAPQAGDDEPF